jgi:flagellar motor switch protein FliG
MALPPHKLEKVAALLSCFGDAVAQEVLAHLDPAVAVEVAERLGQIGPPSPETQAALMSEFMTGYTRAAMLPLTAAAPAALAPAATHGSPAAPAAATSEAPAAATASEHHGNAPFAALFDIDPHRLLEAVAMEPPSIIALLLYFLPREQSGIILSGLTDTTRQDVVLRLANIQQPTPQVVARLERLLLERLHETTDVETDASSTVGAMTGARALVEILGRSTPEVEARIFEFLQDHDPALAEEVRKQMFVFEDLVTLDGRSLQILLREMSPQELALALKGTDAALQNCVFSNVSENFAKSIKEETELLGAVRMSMVEEARAKVIATLRRLVEEGTITIARADAEELVA